MTLDAATAGMDPVRLRRIDEHLRQRYVDPQKVAGCAVGVVRHGALAHCSCLGLADRERRVPVREDTIWRAYSMTKPVTGVALMTLYERGAFQLDDPVARFVPAWRDIQVAAGDPSSPTLVPPRRPPTVKDVLSHTSGLGYGPRNTDLDLTDVRQACRNTPAGRVEALGVRADPLRREPLRFHPGDHWLYSFGTDVCARLVEVISGRPFDEYLRAEVFGPLGMVDTDFFVPDDKLDRFAANYGRDEHKQLILIDDPADSRYRRRPTFFSGGGGLVTTLPDYVRFVRMLVGGGQLDGSRVLSRKTLELMTVNHLAGGRTMAEMAIAGSYGEVGFAGMGFGLTMAVGLGPALTGVVGSPGEFMWGGAASTTFWVDPVEDLAVVFMTQLMPSGTFNFRGQLKSLVYQAITD